MTDDVALWRSAAYRHARERDEARVERDRYAALLAEASEALRAVGKAAITVEPTLKQPYPDAPDTSPWARWMEAPARRAYNLGHQIRRELNAAPAAPKDCAHAHPIVSEQPLVCGPCDYCDAPYKPPVILCYHCLGQLPSSGGCPKGGCQAKEAEFAAELLATRADMPLAQAMELHRATGQIIDQAQRERWTAAGRCGTCGFDGDRTGCQDCQAVASAPAEPPVPSS